MDLQGMEWAGPRVLEAIPSKGRAGKVRSHVWFQNPVIFVPEAEVKAYQEAQPELVLVAVPDSVKGITRTRNWILDYCDREGFGCCVQADDDCFGFYRFEEGKNATLCTPAEFQVVLYNTFDLCRGLGAKCFGFQLNRDRKTYREYSPFSFSSVVVASLIGILVDDQRFDENLKLKEDYDFSLESMRRNGLVLRHNKYVWSVEHHGNAGGCVDYRSLQAELDSVAYLRRKWGDDIVSVNAKKDYEVICRPPVNGI